MREELDGALLTTPAARSTSDGVMALREPVPLMLLTSTLYWPASLRTSGDTLPAPVPVNAKGRGDFDHELLLEGADGVEYEEVYFD